jgi:ATP-dependent DNA ligase
VPQLLANPGVSVLADVAKDLGRWAVEPKVDGIRCLVVYLSDETIETRNRQGERRDWLRHPSFAAGVRRLAERLPILYRGTVLDGELTTGRFRTTLAAATGSPHFGPDLRLVVFDVPILVGADLRPLPWQERRERLELLGRAFDVPFELSPVVEPSAALAEQMVDGQLEGLVVKDRCSPYRDGSRSGGSR